MTADEAAVNALAEQYFAEALPSTVDDLLNIADTFDAPEGVEGVMKWDVNNIFYNYWIVGNYMIVGGDPGDDRNDIDINNPETIQCLEVYKALNQFFFIESDTVTYDSVIQDFIDGKTMFTIGTTDVVKRLEEAKADGSLAFNYGIAVCRMSAPNCRADLCLLRERQSSTAIRNTRNWRTASQRIWQKDMRTACMNAPAKCRQVFRRQRMQTTVRL